MEGIPPKLLFGRIAEKPKRPTKKISLEIYKKEKKNAKISIEIQESYPIGWLTGFGVKINREVNPH